jgi:hypothetical protein
MSISKINTNSIAAGASPTMTDLTLSGSLFLGGTGSANELDDYEEGTWTPTLTVGGGTLGSYGDQNGYYTKIGNIVRAWCYVSASKGTATGNISVGGLPFASARSERGIGAVDWFFPGGTGLVNCVAWTGATAATEISLGAITAANADATAAAPTWSGVSTSAIISVSIVYEV